MSAPTTSIRLNSTTPAPPSETRNVVFQSDGDTPQQQVTAYDPVMVGDTGSGGLAGNVPAPAAGDAAAGKVLKADGTWGSGVTSVGGANGDVLTLVSGSPAWQPAGGGALLRSATGILMALL